MRRNQTRLRASSPFGGVARIPKRAVRERRREDEGWGNSFPTFHFGQTREQSKMANATNAVRFSIVICFRGDPFSAYWTDLHRERQKAITVLY